MRSWLAGASVVAIVLGSVGAFAAVTSRERTFAHRRAEAFADRAASAVAAVMQSSLTILAGSSALRAPGGAIDPTAFDVFASEVIRRSTIDAVAISVAVPAAGRLDFERTIGHVITDRSADGSFVPASARPLYFPVRYAIPDDATRRALVGFDIGGDPERSAAVTRASVTGEPQVSPVTLAPSNRPGLFVVYLVEEDGAVVALTSGAFLGAKLAPLIASLLPPGS